MAEELNRDSHRESNRSMRDERLRTRFERRTERLKQRCGVPHAHKEWIGIGVIVVGAVWLMNVLGVPLPNWVFSWPMLLIAIGIFTGFASRFHNFGSVILILVGLAFLTRNFVWPSMDIGKFIWPVVVIIFGILFLLRRRGWETKRNWFMEQHPEWKDKWKGTEYWQQRWHHPSGWGSSEAQSSSGGEQPSGMKTEESTSTVTDENSTAGKEQETPQQKEVPFNNTGNSYIDDWLEVTTVFGGVRRMVISKNFKGGELINICGGSEIDLTRADINGTAVIDITNIWGGCRIAVPPNWQVRTNLTHVMAGVDERKRSNGHLQDPNKVLVLTGVVLMGGIEIKDFL